MTDLVVIVPSRGRPLAAKEMGRAFQDTHAYRTRLVFAVDADDPTLADYGRERLPGDALIVSDAPSNMVQTLNYAARRVLEQDRPEAIAFMGDDHRPRHIGWDESYLEALRERPGMVYGNDLIQGAHLPTQIAMSASVVRALGHMAPPTLTHLYVDNYWLALGRAAGCITYLPDVVIEHMHPVAGKAAVDEGYSRVNAPEMYERDSAAFADYLRDNLAREVDLVKAALAGVRA